MKTIILVQEVAERNAFKKQALSALCRSLYCADDYRLENEYRFLLPNNRKLCIGASDSSGRCDLNKLRYLLSEHDLVIVPAINGKNESKAMNSDEFKGYLKMIVPLSRKSDSIDEDFSDFVKQIHSIILK